VGSHSASDSTFAAVAAIRRGAGVVVVDDADRENEGDVIFAASFVSETQIAFMMNNCRGLICAAMSGEDLDRLGLPPMVRDNLDPYRTAFAVSVDARVGVTTGISAADRARTARLLADPTSTAEDFVAPGHLFPLRAVPGGVRSRRGHTEAAIELTRLAGLAPVGIICEVAGEDGRMLRGDDLRAFARVHGLPMLSISDLVSAVEGE
jgi:3,4-dihydroxy 2-butanone 4-phosphate synthase/GTP cyclohydrolase II